MVNKIIGAFKKRKNLDIVSAADKIINDYIGETNDRAITTVIAVLIGVAAIVGFALVIF